MAIDTGSEVVRNDDVPQPASWRLSAVLLAAVESQARVEGVSADEIAARVVEAGLNELGLLPNGRCSLRTGLCGGGPVPLPIQQQGSSPL
jgi:hypothetical protein